MSPEVISRQATINIGEGLGVGGGGSRGVRGVWDGGWGGGKVISRQAIINGEIDSKGTEREEEKAR